MPPSRTSVLQGRERVSDKPAVTAEAEAEKLLPCKEPRHCRVAQDNGRCVWFGCQGGMRPAVAQALATKNARIAALEATLTKVAKLSPMPDNWDFYDEWGDQGPYQRWSSDGSIETEHIDSSNHGDIHDHGIAEGEHNASLIARTALSARPGGE